ncbi:hypothetical protein WJX77_008986 [Trebouxia sp. C0004]
MNAPELELLFRELRTSPDFCTLIRSIQEPHTADHPQQNGERPDDQSSNESEQAGPPDDLLCSARTLFEQCQQMTCTTSDTTLTVKGLTDQAAVLIQVHRCVLAARSPFFQALFSKTWTEPSSENIAVSTEECCGEQAVAVIGYLYTGSIDVDVSTAAEVISLADLWQLPGLINLIAQHLSAATCQGFRRPTGPSDSLVADMPPMAAFAKAASDGGIEHDAIASLYQSCVAWLAKHALLAWPTKPYALLPAKIRLDVRAKAKTMLNVVTALPQLEQADKLLTRLPQAKWAADMHTTTKAWRAEVLQFIAENIPKIALTSAFVERLQSEWSLEHIQQIAEAVKLEYGASRAGYALEVYLGLQRLQASTESGSFSEAEEVKELLDSLKDHCWNYILRNWHLLQRTPTYKVSLPLDQRQRLAADVKEGLSHITTLDSPGDQSQSMGFSVLWDASNTQPDAGAANALTPDGKRPVSKATEKRRQRLAEEQEQRRQEEEKRVLQQRRQQTVKEIRQRQAAAAAQAGTTSQSASSMTTQPASSTKAGSSRLNTSLDGASQGGGGLGAASPNAPQQSQQRAELRGNGRNGPQQSIKRAGLRAESQQGTGVPAEDHRRAGSRTPSKQKVQQANGARTGQSMNRQQSAESSAVRQGSFLRAAAPLGHRQSTGQTADQQQQLRTVDTAAQKSKSSVVNRPSSCRSGQGAAEQKTARQRPGLQGASAQQQQQTNPPSGGQSGMQADSLEASVQLRMNSSLALVEANREQDEASESNSNALGRQSLQQL